MHKCAAESSTKPQRAEGLRARVTPTQDSSEVLLSWSDVEERCVRMYEVDFSCDATAASRSRVNQCDDFICHEDMVPCVERKNYGALSTGDAKKRNEQIK